MSDYKKVNKKSQTMKNINNVTVGQVKKDFAVVGAFLAFSRQRVMRDRSM